MRYIHGSLGSEAGERFDAAENRVPARDRRRVEGFECL